MSLCVQPDRIVIHIPPTGRFAAIETLSTTLDGTAAARLVIQSAMLHSFSANMRTESVCAAAAILSYGGASTERVANSHIGCAFFAIYDSANHAHMLFCLHEATLAGALGTLPASQWRPFVMPHPSSTGHLAGPPRSHTE